MASSPALKIYTPEGEYMGSVKEVAAAALLVEFYGEGSTIRHGHSKKGILWTEGVDGQAAQSYDTTGEKMLSRIHPAFASAIIY